MKEQLNYKEFIQKYGGEYDFKWEEFISDYGLSKDIMWLKELKKGDEADLPKGYKKMTDMWLHHPPEDKFKKPKKLDDYYSNYVKTPGIRLVAHSSHGPYPDAYFLDVLLKDEDSKEEKYYFLNTSELNLIDELYWVGWDSYIIDRSGILHWQGKRKNKRTPYILWGSATHIKDIVFYKHTIGFLNWNTNPLNS